MSDREHRMEWHARAVRKGFYPVARRILRAALRFRPGGRQASLEWHYFINGGKLDWFQFGN